MHFWPLLQPIQKWIQRLATSLDQKIVAQINYETNERAKQQAAAALEATLQSYVLVLVPKEKRRIEARLEKSEENWGNCINTLMHAASKGRTAEVLDALDRGKHPHDAYMQLIYPPEKWEPAGLGTYKPRFN